MDPFFRAGLWLVDGSEGQSHLGSFEGLLHSMKLEVGDKVSKDLEVMTNPGEQMLQNPKDLRAGGTSEQDGIDTVAENIFQN